MNKIVSIHVEDYKHQSNIWSYMAVSAWSIKAMGDIPGSSALFKTNHDGDDILVKDDEKIQLKDGDRFYGVPHVINAS